MQYEISKGIDIYTRWTVPDGEDPADLRPKGITQLSIEGANNIRTELRGIFNYRLQDVDVTYVFPTVDGLETEVTGNLSTTQMRSINAHVKSVLFMKYTDRKQPLEIWLRYNEMAKDYDAPYSSDSDGYKEGITGTVTYKGPDRILGTHLVADAYTAVRMSFDRRALEVGNLFALVNSQQSDTSD